MSKLISFILPCYNVEKYIDRAIKSILAQTFDSKLYEIICIDDASNDNTLLHLTAWEEQYPELITIVKCCGNSRQGTARNIGLKYATGEWITFLDADDWLEKDFLEKLYSIVAIHDLQVIYCGVKRDTSSSLSYFDDSRRYTNDQLIEITSSIDRNNLILSQVFGGAPAKLIKKSLLVDNNIYFAENIAYEDLFWREIFHLYVNKGAVLGEYLYHYYVNPESTTLKKNASYHYDYFISIQLLWDEWTKRGFLSNYRDALECELLFAGYLQYLKVLAIRFDHPSYERFLELQKFIRSIIPDYSNNPYIQKHIDSKHHILLEAIYQDINATEFNEFVKYATVLLLN